MNGLLDFFVHGVLVAVGAKLLEFDAAGSVATVFLSGVSRHAIRPLVVIGAALRALKGNY